MDFLNLFFCLPVFLPFCRSIRVPPLWITRLNIAQPVVVIHAVSASNHKFWLSLRFFSHLSDTQPTNVVLAAATHQYCVEVSEAHGATVFVLVTLVRVKCLNALDIAFAYWRFDSHFIPCSHFLQIHFIVHCVVDLPNHISLTGYSILETPISWQVVLGVVELILLVSKNLIKRYIYHIVLILIIPITTTLIVLLILVLRTSSAPPHKWFEPLGKLW